MRLIPEKMAALVWVAPNEMELQSVPLPTLAPEEVLIQVVYSGICGSELSGYLGHNGLRTPPLVMGHEFSGEIVALGDQALERNPLLSLGQAVTANPLVYCGTCEYCQRGLNQLCTNRSLISAKRPGAFAGFIAVPAWMVIPLPASLGLREGALTEPLACGVRAARWTRAANEDTVLVVGAGPIGLLTLQALLLNGAGRVFIADTDPQRLAAGQALGGDALNPRLVNVVKTVREATSGLGAAAAVDAVGKAVTREQCISATRSGGTVVFSGLHEETSSIPAADIIRREITLHGSFCYTPSDFHESASLLARDKVTLDPWIIEAPLSEGGAWFERLSAEAPGGVAKVLLKP